MFKHIAIAAIASFSILAGAGEALAEGDATLGKKVFNKCRACHTLKPGRNMTGPSLAGIMDKGAALDPKFRYSKVMREAGWTWDDATMATFLTKPKKALKGTKMTFIGLKKPEDIANLIAYLREN